MLKALALSRALVATLGCVVACAQGHSQRTMRPPEVDPLSPGALERRLSAFAADSMLGRLSGTPAHEKAVDYLAAELRRFGVSPAGERGTYFQTVPPRPYRVVSRNSALIAADGSALVYGEDYRPIVFGGGRPRDFDGARVVFGGTLGDTVSQIPASETVDRLVVLADAPAIARQRLSRSVSAAFARFSGARAVAVAVLDRWQAPPPRPGRALELPGNDPTPSAAYAVGLVVSTRAAALLLGAEPNSLAVGTLGGTVRGRVIVDDSLAPMGRNVVAVLQGRDLQLQHEYIALGAHSDGEGGIAQRPLDHDSVRAAHHAERSERIRTLPVNAGAGGARPPVAGAADLLHRSRAAVQDSINNAADDDGSGSVALLAIAEVLARDEMRPRRSILFVWHAAEEQGTRGSRQFVERPTVPNAAITAQLNLDMVGRGGAEEVSGGGPRYLLVAGARRRSSQLGQLIDSVNARQGVSLALDTLDREGWYARSDHVAYACRGIPVALFTTGGHRDYHSVTDEARYVDYEKLSRVARLVRDVARTLADRHGGLALDGPAKDPELGCR